MAVLRFVDSIASSPTVRLDLNDSTFTNWTMNPETSFGMPAIKRTISSSMLRDGEYVGATAYGNREIALVLNLKSTTADAAATQLQTLNRELDRATNILQYQAGGMTAPVFFRTFRSAPENVRWDPDNRSARATVMAEPFALGLRENLGPFTLNSNPAAGSNGLFLNLTSIKGDVETPIFFEYLSSTADPSVGLSLGVRSGASPYPAVFRQAEALTMDVDATVTADAAMSGGSKVRVSFASGVGMFGRVRGRFPTASSPAGPENVGVYRVFARVAQTVGTDTIQMQLVPSTGYGSPEPERTLFQFTNPQLVDLGLLFVGNTLPPAAGYESDRFDVEFATEATVAANRVSGSGSLDIDYIALVPADERYGQWSPSAGYTGTYTSIAVDGINEVIYQVNTPFGATNRAAPQPWRMTGGFPYVRPGDNRLVFVVSYGAGLINALSESLTVNIRYWPRYLHVRPPTT